MDSLFSATLLYKSETFGWDLEGRNQACRYGKKWVWRWRRSNLTRTIPKIRTSRIPMQGMKCTTLKSKGLPELESSESTPGWKSTMLALFGKIGLSELWYKDQTRFSIESSNTCVELSDWVLHGMNQTSSLEVWDWVSRKAKINSTFWSSRII